MLRAGRHAIALGTALLVSALLAVVPQPALGCEGAACDEKPGVVVARGESLYGVPWQIEAKRYGVRGGRSGGVELHFSISPRGGGFGVGYSSGLSLPLRPSFMVRANAGSGIDRYPESDLSGVTRHRVARLVVTMRSGERVVVRPQPAPRRQRRRLPWLRGLRFFDAFFAASEKPRLVTAFDRHGRLLARLRSDRGSFG